MPTILRIALLAVYIITTTGTAQELTPTVDLNLQPVTIEIPERFRAQLGDENLTLNLPPGFSARVFAAAGLFGPRFMAFDDEGVLHVANMRVPGENKGQIVALPDRDQDGVADERVVVANGFRRIHSLAFYKGDLYAADNHQLVRLIDENNDGFYESRDLLAVLPSSDDVYQGRKPGDETPAPVEDIHPTRTLAFDEVNQRIYVSVGSTCDLCREVDPERATVLAFDLDGANRRIYASGLRNATGLALHPQTNELWVTVNGHDRQGNTLPPETVYIARNGSFHGWPFAYAGRTLVDFNVPAYKAVLPLTDADRALVRTMPDPIAAAPARLAPMAIHFNTGRTFPARYRDAAFVVFRAGHNAAVPGWKVVTLFSEPDGSDARLADFLTGLGSVPETGRGVWGTPVGLAQDTAGHLYLSTDFVHHAVLRIEAPVVKTAVGASATGPEAYALAQNKPNPFNAQTQIGYRLPGATRVTLTLYNAQGQSVRQLKNAFEPAGAYTAIWDGENNRGQRLASGLYFYRLQTAYGVLTRRLILLK